MGEVFRMDKELREKIYGIVWRARECGYSDASMGYNEPSHSIDYFINQIEDELREAGLL